MSKLFARIRPALSRPTAPLRRIGRATGALVLAGLVLPASASAQDQENFAFDITYGPLTVARISVASREGGNSYAVAADIRATGLAAAFARVNFTMNAQGYFGSPSLHATSYRETVDTGQRQSSVDMVWQSGTPVIRSQVAGTGSATPVPPSRGRGAVDPLTAMYRLARARPEGELCNWSASIYDGARLAAVALGPPSRQGDMITCNATHRRLEGFPADDLGRFPAFNFTATFRPAGDGLWHLTEVASATIYGTVRMERRN
ncbi:DUF3108 domain-containing protein [Maritalea mobilis]|uniref:DUF3108 domain-containing protein n=1 Tax=Maritalea mobilis TaxID=483324 RepID=UPI001C98DFD9|nr:DUF3108 domain-containing protein [Maritalea mobilis]MBY6202206.1 DUF3108 domain-containing protein [Maritalea mobilis]